jgi:FMN phosphatase YigB (HAD superfamily)
MLSASPDRTTIFIDDGGVMNDNVPRGDEWRRLVGEFFAPVLGGSASAWANANRVVFAGLEPLLVAGPLDQDYTSWFEAYQLRWLSEMAAFVGAAPPAGVSASLALIWQATDHITQRVKSAYPGAAEAVRVLDAKGYNLCTASGEHSRELDGYLRGMGIRQCFRTPYGADLINQGKYSVDYYRNMFEAAAVIPANALVVDDRGLYLEWAATLGATTCLVGPECAGTERFTLRVDCLAELPSALDGIVW